MENFEKYTVAMLRGPCSQDVTGNTSRQNQPQSAIMHGISQRMKPWEWYRVPCAMQRSYTTGREYRRALIDI